MNYEFDVMSPPEKLAIAHSKLEFRSFFSLLLELDSRLKRVCLQTSEPLIGQLKLAWWRDTINTDSSRRPTGEPLLARFAEFEAIGQGHVARMASLDLVAGWEALTVQPDDVMAASGEFASLRSTGIFGGFASVARLEKRDLLIALGTHWALDEMGLNNSSATTSRIDRALRHRSYRPLTVLAYAAQLQRVPKFSNGIKLSWHALTGQ
jgi:15-cis-phytoene synthase